MDKRRLEPELLPVFQLFTGLRVGLILLALLSRRLFQDELVVTPNTARVFSLVEASLLLVYLFWPWLRRQMGRAYLPIALGIATLGPIASQAIELRIQRPFWFGPLPFLFAGAWQLIPILFVPLVLIAWQYRFRAVVAFCLLTAALDLGMTAWVMGGLGPEMYSFVGVLFIRTISFLFVGYMVARLMSSQREQRLALSQANARLMHYAATQEQLTVSQERNRLARDLHDILAHTLSGMAVQLEAVKTIWEADPPRARAMLEEALTATREGLTEARRALQALRASPIEDLGLILALRDMAEAFAARASWSLDLQLPESLDEIPHAVETCLYRVAQEALANADQHAGAGHVLVRLNRLNGQLELTVQDDGQGFDLEAAREVQRFGLTGMRERAEMVGGRLWIASQPGRGTTLQLIVEV